MRNSLAEKVKKLPPDLQKEVDDFVQFLLERKVRKPKRKLRLDWAGALRDLRGKYSSVELQHQVLSWWGD